MHYKSRLEKEMEIIKNHKMIFNFKIAIQTMLLVMGTLFIMIKNL